MNERIWFADIIAYSVFLKLVDSGRWNLLYTCIQKGHDLFAFYQIANYLFLLPISNSFPVPRRNMATEQLANQHPFANSNDEA